MNKNILLISKQISFKTNRFNDQAITTIYDNFLDKNNILCNKQYTCAIFLDMKKAFDSIDHQILLKKLYHYGFRGKI